MLGNAFTDGTLLEHAENVNGTMKTFMYIALVMGLLLFAHKVPKMLGELFPKMGAASGNFGLKAGERGLGRLAGSALGVATGAGWGLATGVAQGIRRAKSVSGSAFRKGVAGGIGGVMGAVKGTVGGTVRGLYNGAKKGSILKNGFAGAKNQAKVNQRFGNKQENGYGIVDQTQDRARAALHLSSRTELLEDEKAPITRKQEVYKKVQDTNDKIRSEAESQVRKGKGKYSGELEMAEKRLANMKDDANYEKKTKQSIATSSEYLAKCKEIENNNEYDSDDKKLEAMEKLLNTMTDEKVADDFAKAQKAVKKAKDKAINDFITNGEYEGQDTNGNDVYRNTNATIMRLRSELINEMIQYNANEGAGNRISDEDVAMITEAMNNGENFDNLIKGAEQYEGKGITDAISEASQKLVEISQKQQAIKRQTSGSGIGEDKR